MQRIEPTIASLDIDVDAASADRLRTTARKGRTRKAVVDWVVIVLLFGSIAGVSIAAASHAGIIPEQFQFGAPKLFERVLIVVGFALALGSQVVGAMLAFRRSFVQGTIALLLPGYVYIALKRNRLLWPVLGWWLAGICAIVIGTILLA